MTGRNRSSDRASEINRLVDILSRYQARYQIWQQRDIAALGLALVDIREALEAIYQRAVPALLGNDELTKESVEDILWEIREQFRHIDYHIHDAKLTD